MPRAESAAVETLTAEADVDTFGQQVSHGSGEKLRAAAYVRSLDPCALLDEAFVGRYGTVVQFGPTSELSSCSALVIDPANPRRTQNTIELDLFSPGPSEGDVPVILDDVAAARDDLRTASPGCGVLFPVSRPTSTSAEPQADIVELPPTTFARVSADIDADCTIVDTTANRVVRTLSQNPPLRAGQASSLDIAAHSPCELLGNLKYGITVKAWVPTTQPYACDADLITRRGVEYHVVVGLELGWVSSPSPVPDRTDVIDGRPMAIVDGSVSCSGTLDAGDPFDITRDQSAADLARVVDGRYVPRIAIYVDRCVSLDDIALIAVESFLR